MHANSENKKKDRERMEWNRPPLPYSVGVAVTKWRFYTEMGFTIYTATSSASWTCKLDHTYDNGLRAAFFIACNRTANAVANFPQPH